MSNHEWGNGMERVIYNRWSKVPDNLKTKTQLKKLKLTPLDENNPQAKIETRHGSRINTYNLYDISLTQPIKHKVVDLSHFELSPKTIAEALYVINKSAKKSRDTKAYNYEFGNYSTVSRAKSRESKIYKLKNKVLECAIDKGIATEEGYHTSIIIRTKRTKVILCNCCDENDLEYEWECYCECHELRQHFEWQTEKLEETAYLKILRIEDFTFHLPSEIDKVGHLSCFGEIGRISAEKTRKVSVGFQLAKAILNQFVNQ